MLAPLPAATQVFLAFPEDYPDAVIAAIVADFAGAAGGVQVQKMALLPTSPQPWAAPTAITAHLSAAFMTTLRPGAATPDTPALLAGLQGLARHSHAAPTAAPHRYHQSADFSIVGQGPGGQQLKMLFDTDLGPATWAAAIAEVLPVVAAHYLQGPAPAALPAALAGTPAPLLYLAYHRGRKGWELQNAASMQALHRRG